MKLYISSLLGLTLTLGIAACTGSSEKSTDSEPVNLEAEVATPQGPTVAVIRSIQDSFDSYSIHSECQLDSASVVECAYGQYYDNKVTLHIEKEGSSILDRTFTKHDFKGAYDADKNVLVGFILKEQKDGLLIFSVEVGDPDNEEGGACFFLKVDKSGGYTISVDTTQDTSSDGE